MKSAIKIILMASITFGTVGILYFLDSFLINKNMNLNEKIFTDSLGRKVKVPDHPERMISIAPVVTEILYALAVDDRLVGVTDYCDYPEEAKEKPSIGGFSTPNLELIISLEPDLVFSTRDDPEIINALEDYDIAIVVLLAYSLEDVIERINDIGFLVDEEKTAEHICEIMTNKMNIITSKTSSLSSDQRIKCYFEIWSSPKVAGADSYLNDMMERAGGNNIFSNLDGEWVVVNHESVIEKNPGVIFVFAHGIENYQEDISDRPGYEVVDAVINNRVYVCDDIKFARAGPRIIDALEEMALYLHPDLFEY